MRLRDLVEGKLVSKVDQSASKTWYLVEDATKELLNNLRGEREARELYPEVIQFLSNWDGEELVSDYYVNREELTRTINEYLAVIDDDDDDYY